MYGFYWATLYFVHSVHESWNLSWFVDSMDVDDIRVATRQYNPSLFRCLMRVYGRSLLTAFLCKLFVCDVLLFVGPVIQKWDLSAVIDNVARLIVIKFPATTLTIVLIIRITRYAQRAQTSADPEDSDFGLWTPGSEAWSESPQKLYHLVLEPCPTPPKNFVKIRSQVCE